MFKKVQNKKKKTKPNSSSSLSNTILCFEFVKRFKTYLILCEITVKFYIPHLVNRQIMCLSFFVTLVFVGISFDAIYFIELKQLLTRWKLMFN